MEQSSRKPPMGRARILALVAWSLLLCLGCEGELGSPTEVAPTSDTGSSELSLNDLQAPPGSSPHCPPTIPFVDASGSRALSVGDLSNLTCETTLHYSQRHVLVITADLPEELVPPKNVSYDFEETGIACQVWARPPVFNPEFKDTDNYRFRLTSQGVLKGRCTLTDL